MVFMVVPYQKWFIPVILNLQKLNFVEVNKHINTKKSKKILRNLKINLFY